MKISRKTKNTRHLAWRFGNLSYRAFSACLLVVMFLMPLAPTFANEEVVEQTETNPVKEESVESGSEKQNTEVQSESIKIEADQSASTDEEEPQPDIDPAETTPNDTSTDSITNENSEPELKASSTLVIEQESTHASTTDSTQSTSTIPDLVSATTTATDQESSLEGNASSTDESDASNETETVPIDENTPTATSTITEQEPETPPEDTVTNDVPNEGIPTQEETPGDATEEDVETPEPQVAMNIVLNEENQFNFSKDECVVVSDGTFYCTKATESASVIYEDRVFSAPDSEGDKEIFIEQDAKLTQITDNTQDDDAPQFDEMSNSLVWHRLIDGRYQIISYDLESQEEEQITDDRYNNMQPHRFGDALVWQGWVGSDWEIFLLHEDELTMLTDNQVEDITPSINGNHVVWQSFEENAWKMKVYDIRTKSIQTIEDAEGGSIQNPRFVLVYDTKFETGDVETRGFDLESGEVVPLGTSPAPVPENIPDPDEIPEERALISPTLQLKKESEGEGGDDTDTQPQATTTDDGTGDVIVPPFADESASTSATSTDEEQIDSEDLIVPEITKTATSSVEHIPDLIIETSFEPEISTTTEPEDSQESVATTT